MSVRNPAYPGLPFMSNLLYNVHIVTCNDLSTIVYFQFLLQSFRYSKIKHLHSCSLLSVQPSVYFSFRSVMSIRRSPVRRFSRQHGVLLINSLAIIGWVWAWIIIGWWPVWAWIFNVCFIDDSKVSSANGSELCLLCANIESSPVWDTPCINNELYANMW